MNWIIYLAVWLVLLAFVVCIGVYRVTAAHHLDASFHLIEDDKQVSKQLTEEKTIEGVDFWGIVLTAVVIVYGIALAVAYGWHLMNQPPKWP
jgi:uncharacterized membrane protein (DUF485 family)